MSTSGFQGRGAGSHGMRVVAVTGTSGKTTTAWLTASVLGEAGLAVGVISDLGCVDADGGFIEPPAQWRPDSLAAWIERLADRGCSHAVVEVSHDLLAAGAIGRGGCDAVIVTNAARGPRAARPPRGLLARRIVSSLARGGCLVAPPERRFAGLFAAAARRPGIACLTTGFAAASDVAVQSVERGLHGRTFLVSGAGQVVPVAVDVPVASFARNAACAAAVGLWAGVPLQVVARGIEAAGCVAGRNERLDRGQDFAAFLDAPGSGHALSSTLASLRRLTPGRLAVVAEQRLVDELGAAAFSRPVRRCCDDVVVVPDGVLDDSPDDAALAAYARIDRLLGRLGRRDCLLVLGGHATPSRPDPRGGVPLVTLVDGWLRLAHPPEVPRAGARRAA